MRKDRRDVSHCLTSRTYGACCPFQPLVYLAQASRSANYTHFDQQVQILAFSYTRATVKREGLRLQMSAEPPRKKSKWDEDIETKEQELKQKVKKLKKVKAAVPASPVASTSKLTSIPKATPGLTGCRSVYNYERLNHIEEGSYGVVSRARDKETGEM